MIISISAKAGSGKDIIGKIIQYLTSENNRKKTGYDISFDEFVNKAWNEESLSGWQIKKFADKLKDIVCIILGCTREQLEDREFKEKELGKEWWYWYMERDGGYSPIILDYLTTTKKELKNYEGLELIKPTPRFLLQFIGTNLLRNQLHPEIWVNALMSEYKLYKETKPFVNLTLKDEEYPNWIITDMRFPNEMEAVKKKGGITIRVNRPCDICGGSGYHKMSCPVSKSGEHYSEIALDSAAFDFVINNNKDIEHLVKEVKKILKKLNII